MTLVFAVLAAIGFLWALGSDLRRRIIPNRVIAGLGILWIGDTLRDIVTNGWPAVLPASLGLAGALAVFCFCFLCFTRGWIGGGDAKLAPIGALWAGYGEIVDYIWHTALIGGVLGLICLFLAVIRKRRRAEGSAIGIPYGVAIALAALWSIYERLGGIG